MNQSRSHLFPTAVVHQLPNSEALALQIEHFLHQMTLLPEVLNLTLPSGSEHMTTNQKLPVLRSDTPTRV